MIYVELFGSFKMYVFQEDKKVSATFSAKSGCVLAYILLNRKKAITKEEFLDTFWNDPSSSNPLNAFKTLIFRIRNTLNKCLGENNYIIEKSGTYKWNEEIEVEIDVEVFSNLISKISSSNLANMQKIAICESVLKLYKGDFLSNVHNLYWADITSGYYRSLNMKTILQLMNFYKQEKEYGKMENLCVDTLKANYMDEDIYYYLILAKIFLNKRKEAKEIYDEAVEVLKNEMGINQLNKLDTLKEKMRQLKNCELKKIDLVCNEIEDQEINGTFVCSYAVFCEICRLEYRKMLREEFREQTKMASRHIILMTIVPKGQKENTDEFAISESVMGTIGNSIIHNLRSGDVFSRCSSDQFIFLLQGCNIDNCLMVTQRILGKIEKLDLNVDCKIQYQRLSSANILKDR